MNFNIFWKIYPRKVAKKKAELIWNKIPNEEHKEVIKGVESYLASGNWGNPKYIPHPTTFLNQERWKDEIINRNSGVIKL